MLKAVIFDMDGVIIDSEPLHARAIILALEPYGVKLSMEYCYSFVGSTAKHLLEVVRETYSITASLEELMEANEQAKKALLAKEEYPAIPYVRELMESLFAAGYQLAIASSSPITEIENTVQRLHLAPYLKQLVSGMQIAAPKPAPDIFLAAAKKLGVHPSECLVIEDSYNGLTAAKAAGMARAAFYNPHSGQQDLSCAHYIIEGFEEITPALLNRIYQHAFGLPATILSTDRLLVRELDLSDMPALHKILAEPNVSFYSGEPSRSLDELSKLHEAYIKSAYHFRGYGLWGVFLKDTEELIGRFGLEDAPWHETTKISGTNLMYTEKTVGILKDFSAKKTVAIELGYLLAPDFWGKGYAAECARAILEYAFRELDLPEVYAVISLDNPRSIKLAETIGMTLCGSLDRAGKHCLLYVKECGLL